MNIRDLLISQLKTALSPELPALPYDVRLQGSYADDEPLPESFITYLIVDSPDKSFYGSNPMLTNHLIQIVFYSKKMSLINTVPDQINVRLKMAGFIRNGKGRDVAFNAEHYAWQIDYNYTERNI